MWPLFSMYVCTFICVTLSPLKACVKVLRNGWGHDWLPAVWYCGETELSQSKKTRITRRNLNPKSENILTYFSLAHVGSNLRIMKKKTGWKFRRNVPLNRILKSPMTPCSMILRGDWLCAVHSMILREVLLWAVIGSAQWLTLRSMILRGNFIYLNNSVRS